MTKRIILLDRVESTHNTFDEKAERLVPHYLRASKGDVVEIQTAWADKLIGLGKAEETTAELTQ